MAGIALAWALGATSPPVSAGCDESEFDEAEVFFELNDTDGDLGFHASIDGEPWTRLSVTDSEGRKTLNIRAQGELRNQGLTQLAFESAEPAFDELAPEEFFARFPEGEYEIESVTLEGCELESTAEVSHVMAAPPGNVLVSGIPAAESCDAVLLPTVSPPVTISWDPVTDFHPEIGRPGPIEVDGYQLFVGELAVDLPPDVTEFEVPASVLELDTDVKFEIIVREATGNNTAVESCFVVVE